MQKVFVLNRYGRPLMSTTPRKARLLLKTGKAKIVKHDPFFTIQLVFGSSGYCQPVALGIDAGYQKIGYSAITETDELLCGELTLLKGVSERLTTRRMYRRTRRTRKRHRQPRFDNRRRHTGWFAPSIQHKHDGHVLLVQLIESFLPVTEKTLEVASFDIHKLKNPTIFGDEYQQGKQYNYHNVREYVLHRDNHECQNPDCKNRVTQKILQTHHISYWQGDMSNRPGNLITLCTTCHIPKNHGKKQFLWGWKPKLRTFKSETFMTTVRKRLVNTLHCATTYGYVTKQQRNALNLSKSHTNDAFVIAGGTTQKRANSACLEQIRRNNRSLQKFYDAQYLDTRTEKKASGQDLFSGRRTRNKQLNEENLHVYRGRKLKKGRVSIRKQRYQYQPKDIVRYKGKQYQVKGMQNYGQYIKLASLNKPVKLALIQPIRWCKGICSVN